MATAAIFAEASGVFVFTTMASDTFARTRGAVVTKDAAAHSLMVGVPARHIGWVSHAGEILGPDFVCPRTGQEYRVNDSEQLELIDG